MKIVIVGAGAAGMAAATRARRVNPTAKIIVLERADRFSQGTCSLPYLLSGDICSPSKLQGISLEELRERRIDLKLNTQAIEINSHQRRLVTSGDSIQYDKLIVGTGSRPKSSETLGINANGANIWQLRTIDQVKAIQDQIRCCNIRRVAVIGGGYVGIEFAEALCKLGLNVTLFHRPQHLMRLHPWVDAATCQLLERQGIQVHRSHEILSVESENKNLQLKGRRRNGEHFTEDFDALALAIGIEPEVSLLQSAGASVGRSGAIVVSSRGETSLSNVYACGDGVEIPNSQGGQGRWIPLATTAARLGRVCGENAAGGSRRCGSSLAALCLRLFNQQLASIGQDRDWEGASTVELEWGDTSASFSRRRPGKGILYYQSQTGRIVGFQALAPEAANLVDILSLCIDQSMTLEDLQSQDFSYNPPLSGLWNPLYLAARKAEKASTLGPGRFR